MTETEIQKSGGIVQTPTGKTAWVYFVNRDTGLVRIRYCDSDKLADILIDKLSKKK